MPAGICSSHAAQAGHINSSEAFLCMLRIYSRNGTLQSQIKQPFYTRTNSSCTPLLQIKTISKTTPAPLESHPAWHLFEPSQTHYQLLLTPTQIANRLTCSSNNIHIQALIWNTTIHVKHACMINYFLNSKYKSWNASEIQNNFYSCKPK